MAGPPQRPAVCRRRAAGRHLEGRTGNRGRPQDCHRPRASRCEQRFRAIRRLGRGRRLPARAAGRRDCCPIAQADPVELRRPRMSSLSRRRRPLGRAGRAGELSAASNRELRPKAIELLTERRAWAEQLLEAIGTAGDPRRGLERQPGSPVAGRRRRGTGGKGQEPSGASLRGDRDPQREEVIARDAQRSRDARPATRTAGQAVFKRVCGQCHKLYGEGQDVGPDITLNGRNSFEQLLSNVFDPSLVIGAAYQAQHRGHRRRPRAHRAVGRGQRRSAWCSKTQGGKLETIARADVDEMKTSRLSLMPEDLEKQLKPQELADLFALLTLDKPPGDPSGKQLPGSQPIVPRETNRSGAISRAGWRGRAGLFHARRSGKPGLAIVAEHAGREGVLRTRPVSRQEPCVLRPQVRIAEGQAHPAGALRVSSRAGRCLELDRQRQRQTIAQGASWAAPDAPAWQNDLARPGPAGRQNVNWN